MYQDSKIHQHLSLINHALDTIFPPQLTQEFCLQQTGQSGSYDYQNLTAAAVPLRYLLSLGGKRWRALALTLSAESFGAEVQQAALLSCLVELTHNGSLIVDDIEDQSPLRRGQPAAHITYGEDYAINIANHAYFMGSVILEQWQGSSEEKLLMYQAWAQALRSLHIGQGLDIVWHRHQSFWPTQDQYLTMCRMKTGALSWLSGTLAATMTGLSLQVQTTFAICWQDIGVGFQILDDVKNLTTGMSGKMYADDLIEGKKSLPLILAAQQNRETARQITDFLTQIKQLTGVAQQDMIDRALDFLKTRDVLHQARQEGLTILESSREKLAQLLPDNQTAKVVVQFVADLIGAMA